MVRTRTLGVSEDMLPELVDKVSRWVSIDGHLPVSGCSFAGSSEGSVWPSEYGGGRPSYVVADVAGESRFEVVGLLTEYLLWFLQLGQPRLSTGFSLVKVHHVLGVLHRPFQVGVRILTANLKYGRQTALRCYVFLLSCSLVARRPSQRKCTRSS